MDKIINLESFAGGALTEQINTELQRVINNVMDPNTDATKTRAISVKIVIKPSKNRNTASVNFETKATLAASVPVETNIIIDRDIKTGEVLAAEIGNQIAGQVEMEIEAPADTESENVIDLKKVK